MFLLAFFITNTYSWWGHAHMIIAEIASKKLSKKQIKTVEKIVNYGSLPSASMVSCATWQDDVKDYGFRGMGNWHFIDTPILLNKTKKANVKPDTYNVSNYLVEAKECLDNPTTTDKWVLGFHLRSIIHFVGDVHTPHHSCQMYSDTLPNGDYGGNLYYLDCEYGSACNNIHFFWDSAGLAYPLLDPLSSRYSKEFYANATELTDKYPENYFTDLGFDLKTFQPYKWANESFTYANNYGYSTEINKRPSDEYFRTVQQKSLERIALAGYRLGYLLLDIFDTVDFDVKVQTGAATREIVIWIVNALLCVGIFVVMFFTIRARKSTEGKI